MESPMGAIKDSGIRGHGVGAGSVGTPETGTNRIHDRSRRLSARKHVDEVWPHPGGT